MFKKIFFIFFLSLFFIQSAGAVSECLKDPDCPQNKYCQTFKDSSDRYCINKKIDGNPCEENNQCQSNSCLETTTGKKCVSQKTGEGSVKFEAFAPQPEIDVPTLQPFTTSGIKMPDAEGYIYVPFLGQYIEAIFRWALLIAGIIATVLIMMGGFTYLTSAGNAQRSKEGKERITQALLGLVLLLASYTILYIVNPDLVSFKSLKIKVIEKVPLTLEILSDSTYTAITGEAKLSKEEVKIKAEQISKLVGLDTPCYMIAIISTESGGNPAVIGHDENYRGSKVVTARKKFLLSGKKYECAIKNNCTDKEIFTPPVSDEKSYVAAEHNKTEILNSDGGISSVGRQPPDYGLDWRFTHGFGLGQITFGDNSKCNGQRGVTRDGKCLTIPDLLRVETAIEASANLFKKNLLCAEKKGWKGDDKIRAAYWAYAAGCGNVPNSSKGSATLYAEKMPGSTKWKPYQSCVAAGKKTEISNASPEGASENE